jgi:hypothetical protein
MCQRPYLAAGRACVRLAWGRIKRVGTGLKMYRVIAIVGGALALAACSSTPDWINLDGLKPAPSIDTVRFETEPPGADAKTSNGQSCRTPCALALPTDAPLTVTFTLNGYLPETDQLEIINTPGTPPQLRPNPVLAELSPAPPPAKPVKKKPVRHSAKPAAKPAAKKPAAPKPAAQAPAPAPAAAAPQQSTSPWPTAPAPQR